MRVSAKAVVALWMLIAAPSVCAPRAAAQQAYLGEPLWSGASPTGVAVDRNGNVYFANFTNYGEVQELSAGCASLQANCTTTTFYSVAEPVGVAVDSSGNIYSVGNSYGVYEIPAGCTAADQASDTCTVTQLGGQPGSQIEAAYGVAVDSIGNIYVAYTSKNEILEMPPGCQTSSCVTVLAGGFNQPYGVAVDSAGNVYVADFGNNAVKEMPPGCTAIAYADNECTVTNLGGGFGEPTGIAVDSGGNIYVADSGNNALKEVTPGCASSTCVSTLDGGFKLSTSFLPSGVAVDLNGDIFVTDTGNNALREIVRHGMNAGSFAVNLATPATLTVPFTFFSQGAISAPAVLTQGATGMDFTNAGTGSCSAGSNPYLDGNTTCTVNVEFTPKFAGPRYGAVVLSNASGDPIAMAYLYGTGTAPQAVFSPFVETSLGGGFVNPQEGIAVDAKGNVFVADYGNNAVKLMPPNCASASCVAQLGGGFNSPVGVALDGSGNVYVADTLNNAVKEMPPGCASSSCVTEIGGGFSHPSDVAIDGSGNVYIADTDNQAVKEMPSGCASSSCVTVLGGGFNEPNGVAVDGSGNVYVADIGTYAVTSMPAGCASASCVTTLGGGFYWPAGVAVDPAGNVYVAASGDNSVYSMANHCMSSNCVNTFADELSSPKGVTLDQQGNVYIVASGSYQIWEAKRATPPTFSFPTPTAAGTTDITDGPKTVTVQNIGDVPLNIGNVAYATDFPEASGVNTDCTSTTSLTAATTCTLTIDFAPLLTSANGRNTSLLESVSLTDNNLNASSVKQSVSVSGTETGIAPVLAEPSPALLAGSTTFTWSPGAGSSMFALWIGTSPGTFNVYTSGHVASSVTSETVSIPANGAKLYVQLWYEMGSTWSFTSYTFSEALSPSLTSPTASPISGSIKFTWSSGNVGPSMFALWIGASPGTNNIYTSGHVANTVTSETVNIPANGATLYASLWYELNGVWSSKSYTFTEAQSPSLTSPTTSLLSGATQFNWSAGTGSSMYALWIGTTPGSNNLYTSGHVVNTVTSETVNIPASGATLYVSLWYELNDIWSSKSYIFTERALPTLTSPTSSPLSGSTQFTWSPGTAGASMYALWVGTSPGTNNMYTSGHVANTVNSETVTIPANGATIYVELWYEVNGAWLNKNYTFTEAP